MPRARRPWAPAAAQPPPRGGEGRGRYVPETWRERGGDGSELATGEARERCSLPHWNGPGPAGAGCAFAAHFLLSSGLGDGVPSGRQRERLPATGPVGTFFLSRALGYVEDPGSASPGRRRREDAGSSWGAAERRGAGRGLHARRGEEQGRGVGGGGGGGTTEEHRSRFARLSVVRCLPDTMALAEVVVCAVGRVVTLPAVEITAQATALLVLVMLSAAEDNGWESPLFSGARGQPAEPRPQRPPRKPLVVWFPGGRKELRGQGRTGTFVKLGEDLNLWIRYLLLKEGMKLSN